MNARFVEVVSEILDLDEGEIAEDLTAESVELWDSLNHLRLVTALEQEFGIKLTMEEIQSSKSLGDLWAVVDQCTAPA